VEANNFLKSINMEDRPWTKYWIHHWKNDPIFGNKRFKKLDRVYPSFDIDESLIDTVNMDEFLKIEEDRIPFFIGSQFGIAPGFEIAGFFNGEKVVAILKKSLMSGMVVGLFLYKIGADETKFSNNEIARFENKEP
jgi:hypothetical protein